MAEKIRLYDDSSDLDEGTKRKYAVEAALELIKADCLGGMGGASTASSVLDFRMEKLSKFADQIQEALKVRK
jgi:hypothetical protein